MTVPTTGAGRLHRDTRGELDPLRVDRAVARFVARQHGVVSRPQLRELGLSDDAIDRRADAGRLHRLHRGVYAVGHTALTTRGHWMAAVLAAGPGAALSHASAAALWDLRRSGATVVDVSVPGRAGRMKRPGLRIHRPRTLRPTEVTSHQGIPSPPPPAPSSTSPQPSSRTASSACSTRPRSSSSPTTPPSMPSQEPTPATAQGRSEE